MHGTVLVPYVDEANRNPDECHWFRDACAHPHSPRSIVSRNSHARPAPLLDDACNNLVLCLPHQRNTIWVQNKLPTQLAEREDQETVEKL